MGKRVYEFRNMKSVIPYFYSIKNIDRQIFTGDKPVLVTCSDRNAYICKYMHSSVSSYRLACELTGSVMAKAWQIDTPKIAFININAAHWQKLHLTHSNAPAIGSCLLSGVVDINSSNYWCVEKSSQMLIDLLRIALFDFWIANEDRTVNNANLLYDLERKKLVSIDYGGIFNTSSFDIELTQLTLTDSILYADLFSHLLDETNRTNIQLLTEQLHAYFERSLLDSYSMQRIVIENIPKEWGVLQTKLTNKLENLFSPAWTASVWDNFVSCLTESI